MFDLFQTVSQQPKINHPKNINLEFQEGQVEQNIGTNYPYQEETIEQEYNRSTEKHYKDSPELKGQIKTSKVIHKLLPKQTGQNKILKLIERRKRHPFVYGNPRNAGRISN